MEEIEERKTKMTSKATATTPVMRCKDCGEHFLGEADYGHDRFCPECGSANIVRTALKAL
jgi:predicted RNA-binding Zn-ribbon protein involved in translation (DUF1610 family)